MSGVGEAVREVAHFRARRHERLVHPLGDDHGGDRQVRGGERLRHAHGRRRDAHRLCAERVAGTPETAHHLVVDEMHAVLRQHCLDLPVVPFGRHDDAAGREHGLRNERGHGLRSLGDDQRFELLREPRRETVLRLALAGLAVVVRVGGVQDVRDRQVEVLVERRQAGQAAARNGDAVVAPEARDDLLLLGLADEVVVVPHQLDLRVVGVRPRQAEEHAAGVERHHRLQSLRQEYARLVGLARKELRIGQLARLLLRNAREFPLGVAQRRAPETRHSLQVLFAAVVPQVDALAALVDRRTAGLVIRQVGGRVEQVTEILRLDRLGRELVVQRIGHR